MPSMTIALDTIAERLAIAVAAKVGKPVDVVILEALEARALSMGLSLPAADPMTGDDRYRRSLAIVERSAARPVLDDRSAEDIIGYDAAGLPR